MLLYEKSPINLIFDYVSVHLESKNDNIRATVSVTSLDALLDKNAKKRLKGGIGVLFEGYLCCFTGRVP